MVMVGTLDIFSGVLGFPFSITTLGKASTLRGSLHNEVVF